MEQETVKGRVKYSKTSCYLCSEWLDDNDVEEHLLHCRQQVKDCPNRCGAIIVSALLQLHLNTCRASYGELEAGKTFVIGTTMASQANDDGELTYKDIIESLETTQRKMKLVIADCYFRISHTQQRLNMLLNNSQASEDATLKAYQAALAQTYQQELSNNEVLIKIRESWTRAGLLTDCSDCSDAKKLKQIEPNADVPNIDKKSAPQEADQPTTSKMADAAEPTKEQPLQERVNILEQKVARYRHETYYTKQRVDDLQDNLLMTVHNNGLASKNGRVMWRIETFGERLANAKENSVLIRGPMFSNEPYGYVLQIEAALDGVGTWRGRNMVVGLSMQSGPYDTLLQWPFKLSGAFILHDQPAERLAAKNIWKPISMVLEKSPGQRQYFVHIPHKVLFSEHFIQNDAIIMEMIIYSGDGPTTK